MKLLLVDSSTIKESLFFCSTSIRRNKLSAPVTFLIIALTLVRPHLIFLCYSEVLTHRLYEFWQVICYSKWNIIICNGCCKLNFSSFGSFFFFKLSGTYFHVKYRWLGRQCRAHINMLFYCKQAFLNLVFPLANPDLHCTLK